MEVEALERRDVPSTTIAESNWSGYAITAAPGTVTEVKGDWVVPTVTGSGTAYSATWVGIDGFNDEPTVEQIGTEEDTVNGVATYSAWYQMYGQPQGNGVAISGFVVKPGDTIVASVQQTGTNTFTLTITEWLYTTQWVQQANFSINQTVTNPVRQDSAEWIEEAPGPSPSDPLPLANFGQVNFSWCYASINNNPLQSIASFTSSGNPNALNMFNYGLNEYVALTSGLDAGTGTSFNVGYSGPPNPSAPAMPTGLEVVDQINQVSLTWGAVTGATSYDVYRSTTPGEEGSIPYQIGIAGTSFTDTSVTDGTTYYYQVTAVNAAGVSSSSTEASALADDGFLGDFSQPASSLPAPWQTVLGGGFRINSSEQAVSAPIVQGLFKAATVSGLSLTSVSVSADVGLNPTPANGISAAAVIVRSQDANDVNNCYFAALTPAPGGLDQILIEKTVNGQITGIAAKALPAGTTSGTLTLDVFGNNLAAYLNGQLEVIGTDNTYTTAGQVGIGAQDQGATFANFAASNLSIPPVPFADDFSRPASATLGNPWYVNYVVPPNSSTAPGGGFGINGSEQAVSLGAGANVATLFGINLSSTTVSATVVDAGAGAGVVADWNNATQSGYGLLLSGSTLQLYKVINGNPMALGLPQSAGGSSGVVGLQVSGGTLSVYFNGGFVFSLADSTFTSGSVGLLANGAGVTFSGFSVTGS